MSDDFNIPQPNSRAPISASYRPRRIPGGLPARPLVLAAAGLGAVLLLGTAGWAVIGHRPATVPVIEADARPIRVKPENAGGMQIAGADDAVLGGGTAGADRMAPTTETPAPQALRAQMQLPVATPATPTPTAANPTAPTTVAPAPAIPTPLAQGASPLPDTPTRPQPATATTQKPNSPNGGTPGGTMVQLAALDSEAAAHAEWARLTKRLPDLLGSHRLVMQKAEHDGQPIYRVRTGGFADTAEATSFCTKLRAKSANCTIASF